MPSSKPAVTQPITGAKGATITKQGHTTNSRFGSNPDVTGKGNPSVRDLNAK